MKKLVFLILTAFLLLSALTACSTDPQAPAATDGGEPTAAPSSSGDFQTTGTPEPDDPPESPVSDFEYQLNSDGGITITKYIGNDANVVVPAYIEEKPVTEIGTFAFGRYAEVDANRTLISVKLPDTVIHIGNQVFVRCTALETVQLPENLQSIGFSAFSQCRSLSSIELPDTLTSMGNSVFFQCKALKSIRIPKQIKVIENFSFCESGLETVVFEEGLEVIGKRAFFWTNLKEIVLPSSVKEIGEWAFIICGQLERIVLNDGLLSIGPGAFSGTALKEVIIPHTVQTVDESVFYDCKSLTAVRFEGNAPETYLSEDSLPDKNLYTIYYHKGAKGFTSPEWNGYPTATW